MVNNLGRRAFIALLGIGAVGGMIGMKLFRNVGFKKRTIARQKPKQKIEARPNPLAVQRTNKDN